MSKADNRPAEEMSMEDILASIRKMIAQDQDVMDASRADRDSGLPSEEPASDGEVLDLIDELPEDGVTVQEDTAPASDAPPAWDSPPEENIDEFIAGHGDDPLDLETEFAIEDSPPPDDTAGLSAPADEPNWGPIDDAPPAQEPIMVGLSIVSEPVEREDGEPDPGNSPRFIGEPVQGIAQATSFDAPDDSAPERTITEPTTAEPTTGELVDTPDGMAHEPHEEVASMDAPKERILSPEAAVKTSAAFDQLAQTLISGYDGDTNTLEGVIRAMLKPLLKEWLDANLPRLVEDIVQAEIRRLSR